MCLAWLLLEPAAASSMRKGDTAYSQQVIICFAQPAIDKRLLGASQSHQNDVLNGFESVQDAGSMRFKTQTSRIHMLLTTSVCQQRPLRCLLNIRGVTSLWYTMIDGSVCHADES